MSCAQFSADELAELHPENAESLAAQRAGICQLVSLSAAEFLPAFVQPGQHHIESDVEAQCDQCIGQKAHVCSVVEQVVLTSSPG